MKEQITEIQLEDGTTTKMTTYANGEGKSRNLILIFPAMGVPASYYQPFAEMLSQQDLVVITADLRGHGHSSVRPSRTTDYGYHEMIEIDYKGVIKKVQQLYPSHKKYLLGHSLGGQIGSLYLSKYKTDFSGLILVACCSVYYKSWKGRSKYGIWMGTQMANLVGRVMGYYPGKRLGFAGTEGRTVMKDWSQQARTGKYIVERDSHDFEGSLKQLNLPVLVLSFKGDTLAPKTAVEHLYQKFSSSAPIQHHHIGEEAGERYSHFSWVKKPSRVVDMISTFVAG